jgi:hypothetical protein
MARIAPEAAQREVQKPKQLYGLKIVQQNF